jgi:hypothetical protein
MAVGLDREISAVAEYLGARAVSVGRFSLDSVRGVGAPVTFATLVQPVGFEPVDVRFRPDSMDRLVEILGGKTLYGDDHFATIRELLQNASDAIHLQRSVSSLTGDEVDRGKIIVTLESDGDVGTLSVADSGIGMSEKVITNYLLGVAADYWNSPDFFADFPGAKASGFLQVGRFGIGFLSVFMLGKDVRVVSERVAGERLVLNLRGLGRRGALVREPARGSPGTTVRVILEGSQTADHRQLARIIRAKAPMLDIPVEVRELGQAEQISPKWWESLSQDQFVEFLKSQSIVARQPNSAQRGPTGAAFVRHFAPFAPDERDVRWRGAHPEIITENYRVLAWPGARGMLLCSKGFAIDWVHSPGLLGLAEIGDVQLNAARSSPLGWDWRTFQDSLLAELTPRIVAALDAMKDELSIPRRYAFLSSVGSLYGANTLKASSLPWVTVVEPPGTATLVSAQEFLSKARQVDELGLVIGADVSPWSATTLVHQRYPETGRRALVVPIDTSSFNVPFNARDGTDVITGTLDALFSSQDRSDVVRRMPLLAATLGLVAEAWAVPVQRLEGVSWSKRLRTLCTRLVRV